MRSIILTGFMGTGKTTVGRLLAARIGCDFLDLDDVVESRAGRSIREIFSEDGEGAFRKLERAALEQVLAGPTLVLATGGGTLVNPEAMEFARSRGVVLSLDAAPEALWARVKDDVRRPLVAGGMDAFVALKQTRDEAYRRADLQVSVDGRAPADIVDELLQELDMEGPATLRRLLAQSPATAPVSDLEVPLGERRYQLEFLAGGRHSLGARLRGMFPKARRVGLVTNATVGALYFDDVASSLRDVGLEPVRIDIPDAEEAKSLEEVGRVIDVLIARRFERGEPLLALGGGVVGDLTGFVASIYLRGVPFVQVPTTLLAQVDSSIGGKTGVNSPRGKNLIGSFYQPSHVLIDVEVLRTLPAIEFQAGMAEVIKYGAIRDVPFLDYLEAERSRIEALDASTLERVIHRSCAHKAEIVVADEREQGERALLNFGHTLGHAFETLAGYHGLKHGQAVAVGMVFAARLSEARGLCGAGDVARLTRLLEAFSLPVLPPACTVEDCLRVMSVDKKVSQGGVKFIVLDALGKARIEPLTFDEIAAVLREFLEVHA